MKINVCFSLSDDLFRFLFLDRIKKKKKTKKKK